MHKPCGYILLDLNQSTAEELRVVADVFDNEITVHIPVNSKKKSKKHCSLVGALTSQNREKYFKRKRLVQADCSFSHLYCQ